MIRQLTLPGLGNRIASLSVLDGFVGLGGWSAAFRKRGHTVESFDLNPRFHPTYVADVLEWEPTRRYDVWLLSPPCEGFTVARIGINWSHDGTPKTDTARRGVAIVKRVLELDKKYRPRFIVIENPVGKLRVLGLMDGFEHATVSYCRYGAGYMKPTDLWGRFPPSFVPRPRCSPGNPDHDPSPRGSKHGVQGFSSGDPRRALVPYELSLDLCLACERDLVVGE